MIKESLIGQRIKDALRENGCDLSAYKRAVERQQVAIQVLELLNRPGKETDITADLALLMKESA